MLRKLGKYELKSELGKGGMSVVYLAEDPRIGRQVAIKLMAADIAGDPEMLKRFYREAQAAGQLRHPNTVTIYDVDEDQGVPYIAMEFLEGEDLSKIIAAKRDLPIVTKLDYIVQACRGLHYAHQHGVVHRDIKPNNIVVLKDGLVKIVDFGIARLGGGTMTRAGAVLGTMMYMSPEQIAGKPVDARSDIFSLGVVLYELLSYQIPFEGPDVPAILYKILYEAPRPITDFIPDCPASIEHILARALEKDRENRYQSAEDLEIDLRAAADSLKQETLDAYLKQAQRCVEAGSLAQAKDCLQRVLDLDTRHVEAKHLMQKVQERIHSQQQSEKIQLFLRNAIEALQAQQYDEAISWFDQLLRLDPTNQTAVQNRQAAIEQRERLRKVAQHWEAAEARVSAGDFAAARRELESLLALDPDHERAQKQLAWVTEELAELERSQQVQQFTEEAKTLIADRKFTDALGLLQKVQELDTVNLEAESLMKAALAAREKEKRQRELGERLRAIQTALDAQEFVDALALADRALREFPDEPQVIKLHAQALQRADIQRKRRHVEEQLRVARERLEKNDYDAAIAVLEGAMQSAPDEPRLVSFLATVREAQQQAAHETLVRDAVRQANEQIRAKNFAAALQTLEKAAARAGTAPELIELIDFAREQQRDQQRQEHLRRALTQAQKFAAEENYAEAVRVLEAAQSQLQTVEVGSHLATVREQWQKFEQRRESTAKHALELLEAGDAAEAVALLDAAPRPYFKDKTFQELYARCRETLQRANFIREALDHFEKALAAEDLERAAAVLQQGLGAYPDDKALLASQRRLREEQFRLGEQRWRTALDEAKVAIGRMEFERAAKVLQALPLDSADFPELAGEAKALLEEARRKAAEAGKKLPTFRPVAPTPRRAPAPAAAASRGPRLVGAIAGGVAVVVLLLAVGAWWYFRGGVGAEPGTVHLTAVPWAEVTGARSADGKAVNVSGVTPLVLSLPPGEYTLSLQSGEQTAEVKVAVEAGKVLAVNYTFPEVKPDAVVDDLLKQY
ncbi:MAG TPA: protein kinase [Candidatus Xenobia bacterium]|nr:protein kinase [Candidatus Xenobia bacterium]